MCTIFNTFRFAPSCLRSYAGKYAVVAPIAEVFAAPEGFVYYALGFYDLLCTVRMYATFREKSIGGADKYIGGKTPNSRRYISGRMTYKKKVKHLVTEVHQQALEPYVFVHVAAQVAPAIVKKQYTVAEIAVYVLVGVFVMLHKVHLPYALAELKVLFFGYIYQWVLTPYLRRSVKRYYQSPVPYPIDDIFTKRGLTRPVFPHHYRYLRVAVLH